MSNAERDAAVLVAVETEAKLARQHVRVLDIEAERDEWKAKAEDAEAKLSALTSLVRRAAPHSWASGAGDRNQRDADGWQTEAISLLKSMDRW